MTICAVLSQHPWHPPVSASRCIAFFRNRTHGSGLKSVPMNKLLEGIAHIFEGAGKGAFHFAIATVICRV